MHEPNNNSATNIVQIRKLYSMEVHVCSMEVCAWSMEVQD